MDRVVWAAGRRGWSVAGGQAGRRAGVSERWIGGCRGFRGLGTVTRRCLMIPGVSRAGWAIVEGSGGGIVAERSSNGGWMDPVAVG